MSPGEIGEKGKLKFMLFSFASRSAPVLISCQASGASSFVTPGIRPAHGVVLVEAVVAVGGFRDLHRVHERPGTTVRKIGDISAVVRVVVGHEDIKVFIVDGKLLQGVFHIV